MTIDEEMNMLKKMSLVFLFSGLALSASVLAAVPVEQCDVTIVVSRNWVNHNITFETQTGQEMGLYQAGSSLVIHHQHPCADGQASIFANPTWGLTNKRNGQHYTSAESYPMNQNIAISFPDDFPNAPLKP